MYVLSVNIGQPQPIENGKKTGKSGIFKTPVREAVGITRDGLDGDAIVDTENHGGVDQAVYVYGSIDYDWWARTLGRDLAPGTFGENLTIGGLESAPLHIGDRLRAGAVYLEVTSPRIPCATLAARMSDPAFVRRFREAERPGVYCRVIEAGAVRAGEPVTLEPYQGATVTVLDMFRLWYDNAPPESALRRELAAPIAIRARQENEARLAKLQRKRT